MNAPMPPRWADLLLRTLMAPRDRQTVSGDLLEEYRERIHPARGQRRAGLWYVRQVAGFAWRCNRTWAGLVAAAFLGRTALDWLVPTTDFHARSLVSTAGTAATFVCVGAVAAWRSRSVSAGALAGVITALSGAVISILGAVLLLTVWHDPATFAAIDGSGGLAEVFTLPVLLVLPGVMLGTCGGLFGATMRRLASHVR